MAKATRLAWALWFACIASTFIAHAEPRHALVIGNSAYEGAGLRLANPVKDAELVADTLGKLGFEVTLATNLSRRAIHEALDKHIARLTGDGVGLVFYSGHGIGFKGANYLIPVNGWPREPAQLETDAVSLDDVVRRLSRLGNRLNIVIVDACRDSPFASRYRSVDRGFAASRAPSGTILAFSTAPGTPALDGTGRPHSPYAEALARAMLEQGVPIERMFKNVREQVGRATKGEQVPWENSSLTGADFYLAPASGAPAFVARAPAPVASASRSKGATRGLNGYDWIAENAEFESRLRYLARDEVADLAREAERGDPLSQTLLGAAYRDGAAGLGRSNKTAIAWLRRAADKGYAIAEHELAEFYFKGRGVARSPERAFELAQRSADSGFPPAIATLGQFYLQGVGTAADPMRGMKLITESLAYGPALRNLTNPLQ